MLLRGRPLWRERAVHCRGRWEGGGDKPQRIVRLFSEISKSLPLPDNPKLTKGLYQHNSLPSPHSGWNKRANLLYIDQPAGTGFSIFEAGEKDRTEAQVSADMDEFLQLFFAKNGYKDQPFYAFGESCRSSEARAKPNRKRARHSQSPRAHPPSRPSLLSRSSPLSRGNRRRPLHPRYGPCYLGEEQAEASAAGVVASAVPGGEGCHHRGQPEGPRNRERPHRSLCAALRVPRRFRTQREIILAARGLELTRLCSHAPVAAPLPARIGQEMAISTNDHTPAVSQATYQIMKAAARIAGKAVEACNSWAPWMCRSRAARLA